MLVTANAKSPLAKKLVPLFQIIVVNHNSVILCSTAMECLFSFGEVVRKPEQSELRNEHFEMLVFWKYLCFNKTLYFVVFLPYSYYFSWCCLLVC